MVQFASYVRRVLHKTRLIFSRINGPIIVTCGSNSLRRGAVRENLTLDALLKFARALELSEQQASQVEKATSDVSVIKTKTNERLAVAHVSETNIPLTHGKGDLSHAIVNT